MQSIKPIIEQKRRQIVGKKLKCRACGCPDAWICDEQHRFYVRCPDCGDFALLKTYNQGVDKNQGSC